MVKYLLCLCAVAAAVAGCAGSSGGGSSAPASTPPTSDPVVLTVNGQPIHRSTIQALQKDLKFAGQPATEKAAESRAIDQTLINQEATRRFITLTPAEENAGLSQALAASGNVKGALKKAGITMAHFREEVNQRLLVRKLIQVTYAKLKATNAQLHERYVKDHHLFYIGTVVRLSAIQARNALEGKEILHLLKQGRSFDDLAKQYNPGGSGADLGWGPMDALTPATRTAVGKLKIGQVAPTPLRFGPSYAVLKLTDRKPAHYDTFAQVKNAIAITMDSALRQKAFTKWLNGQRAHADIQRQ
jgi:parvulin-like peptidyl-prolyl isomerase